MTPNIHDIPGIGGFYTKKEVDDMIAAALAEAKAIDEASMRKHNRDATIISMILGFKNTNLIFQGYDFRNIPNTSSITICRTYTFLWNEGWLL